jgi:hypothetical protein
MVWPYQFWSRHSCGLRQGGRNPAHGPPHPHPVIIFCVSVDVFLTSTFSSWNPDACCATPALWRDQGSDSGTRPATPAPSQQELRRKRDARISIGPRDRKGTNRRRNAAGCRHARRLSKDRARSRRSHLYSSHLNRFGSFFLGPPRPDWSTGRWHTSSERRSSPPPCPTEARRHGHPSSR